MNTYTKIAIIATSMLCSQNIIAITVTIDENAIYSGSYDALCKSIYGNESSKCPGSTNDKAYANLFGFWMDQKIKQSATNLDPAWNSSSAVSKFNILNPALPNDPAIVPTISQLQSDLNSMWTGSGTVIPQLTTKNDLFTGTMNLYKQTFYPIIVENQNFYVPRKHQNKLWSIFSRLLALKQQVPSCILFT